MGNIQGNSNDNRALSKAKRNLRLKSRVISKLVVSSGRKYSSKENTSSQVDDEMDIEFSNVISTTNIGGECANQTFELDISSESCNVSVCNLQDCSYSTAMTYESELTTSTDEIVNIRTPSEIVTEADVTEYGLETQSTCSGSVYFTPDSGCMTEINLCYQSTENLNTNINTNTIGINTDEIIRRPTLKSDVKNTLLRRSFSKNLLNKLSELSKLRIVPQDCIDIPSNDSLNDCCCAGDGVKNDIDNMSVTPSDFRGTKMATALPTITQTPLCREPNADKGIFHVARRKKVELHNLSPKVTDLNATVAATESSTIRNNNNNNVVHTDVQLTPTTPASLPSSAPTQLPDNQTLQATTTLTPEDGNVLKKIVSFTVEKIHSENATVKVSRPSYVPEKLNFSAYERFEGQMLINWMLSSLPSTTINDRDAVNVLILQCCTNLLVAGVIKQIPDKCAPLQDAFRPNLMYRWTHTVASSQANPCTPKKLDASSAWPHVQNDSSNFTSIVSSSTAPATMCTDIKEMQTKEETNTENVSSTVTSNSNNGKINGGSGTMDILPKETAQMTRFKMKLSECDTVRSLCVQIKEILKEIDPNVEKLVAMKRDSNVAKKLLGGDEVDNAICMTAAAFELDRRASENDRTNGKTRSDKIDLKEKIKDCDNIDRMRSNGMNKSRGNTDNVDQSTQTDDVPLEVKSASNLSENQQNVPEQKVDNTNDERPAIVKAKAPLPPPPPPLPPSTALPSANPPKSIPPPPPPMANFVAEARPTSVVPVPPPLPPASCVSVDAESATEKLKENRASKTPAASAASGIPPPPPVAPGIPPPPPVATGIPPPPPPVMSQASNCIAPGPPPPGPLGAPGPAGPPGPPGPAPLPMPSAGNAWLKNDTLRKNALNPPKPMKPLYWTRIVAPVETPTELPPDASPIELWQEIDETKIDNLDEFTELFSRQTVVPVKTKIEAKPVKIQTIKVLDSKRSQSVGIFSRSLHLQFAEIEHAIYSCNTSDVSLETWQQLMDIKATPEELVLIQEATATQSGAPLDAPERFLLKLSNISCFSERIACIVFQAEFDEGYSLVQRKVDTVTNLCDFIIENENLKHLFSIILTLGNYMNGGNRMRGQADGFGLEILPKLKDVKSKDSNTTLLHFIVRTYIKKARDDGIFIHDIALPVPDAVDVNKALFIDFLELQEQVKGLKRKLSEFRKITEKVIECSTKENVQPFKDKTQSFFKEAIERIDKQHKTLEKSKKMFLKTLRFYKYVPKSGTINDCTPGQFFEFWAPFTNDFRDIWKKEMISIDNELMLKAKKTQQKSTTEKTAGKVKSKSSFGLMLKDRIRRNNQNS